MRDIKAVFFIRLFCLLSLCAVGLTLSGCGALSQNNWAPESAGTNIAGMAHAGEQPVNGGKVYLYAAPSTGYGNASVSLLTNAVLTNNTSATDTASFTGIGGFDGTNYYVATDAHGYFSVSNDWTCVAGTNIYFLLVGGNPGGYGTNNNLIMMAALGNCSTVPSFTYINEVSSVASVYSLGGFMSSPTQVSSGTSTAAKAGLAAAFATMTNLETISTGVALAATPGTGAVTGVAPQATVNTLANILAVCENSAGGVAGDSSVCGKLFTETTPSGGTAPKSTLQAALNLVHNPGTLGSTLYSDLAVAQTPFTPDLGQNPYDWTLPIVFSGGGMENLYDIAIDGNNNVWAISDGENGACGTLAASTGSNVVELTNLGVAKSGSLGYTNTDIQCPFAIAIDTSNQAWVVNDYVDYLNKITTTGGVTDYTSTGKIDYGNGLAFDSGGYLWITNYLSTYVSRYLPSGNSWSTYTGAGVTASSGGVSWGIAADGNGHMYIASDAASGRVDVFNNPLPGTTTPTANTTSTGYTGAGITYPLRLAVDQSNNVWVANFGSNPSTAPGTSLSEFSLSGTTFTAVSPTTGYTGGGLDAPFGVAVDGGNHIWVADAAAYGVSEFDSFGDALSPTYGFIGTIAVPTTAAMYFPEALAIDEAGNVWVANYGVNDPNTTGTAATPSIAGSITELVGAATPTLTPIAAATLAKTPAAMP